MTNKLNALKDISIWKEVIGYTRFFIGTLGSSFSLPFLIFPYIFSLGFFLF